MEARLQTAQTRGSVGSRLNLLYGLTDHRVDLRHILLHIALRNLKQTSLGLLHEIVNVVALVESLSLNFRGKRDQLPGKIFLRHDTCMIVHMRTRGHTRCQLRRASHLIESAVEAQLLSYRQHVDRLLRRAESLDSLIYLFIGRLIEAVGLQNVTNHGVGIFLKHQSAENGLFKILVLRKLASAKLI